MRAQVDVPLMPTALALAVIGSAKADVRALEADRHAAEADVRLQVTRGYWTLVTARASVVAFILNVSGSISTNTGRAPQYLMAFAVAM